MLRSLMILGTTIAKTSPTLQELYNLEADYAELNLEFRLSFSATVTSLILSPWILRFAEQSCKMKYADSPNTAITGLLSGSLTSELYISLRGKCLIEFFQLYLGGFKILALTSWMALWGFALWVHYFALTPLGPGEHQPYNGALRGRRLVAHHCRSYAWFFDIFVYALVHCCII